MSTDAPEDWGLGATQMHDAAIAAGLVERPERVVTDDAFNAAYASSVRAHVAAVEAARSSHEIAQDAEEQGQESDDAVLALIRQKRMQELRQKREQKNNGSQQGQQLIEIDPSDFHDSIRLASRQSFVLLVVWRPAHGPSAQLLDVVAQFAAKYPQVLCRRMQVSEAIAGLPPQDCPVLLVYRQEKVVRQHARMEGLAGKDTNLKVLEWEMNELGVIECDHLDDDPRILIEQARKHKQKEAEEESDEDNSDRD